MSRGTLIVLGGRGESAVLYRGLATRMTAAGWRVAVRGDVTADRSAAQYWVSNLLQDKVSPGPAILVGSDTGALLALQLAESGVDGVVVAGLPTGAPVERRRLRLVGAHAQGLRPLRLPLLALHGRDDPVAPLHRALEIYCDTPHSDVVVIDTSRHHLLDGVPDPTAAAAVTAFLDRVPGRTPVMVESR
ncbi:hypothetical protein [Mycolicibacterium sp.]|uniref:hypothetical protein n=1 Tax=Mycolicibacterium sp. TaxID=2320850 RepID=UPI003D0BBCE6